MDCESICDPPGGDTLLAQGIAQCRMSFRFQRFIQDIYLTRFTKRYPLILCRDNLALYDSEYIFLLFIAMIPAFHSYDSSKEQTLTSAGLNNATYRFHSCLPADYIFLFHAWGSSLDLKGQTEKLFLY